MKKEDALIFFSALKIIDTNIFTSIKKIANKKYLFFIFCVYRIYAKDKIFFDKSKNMLQLECDKKKGKMTKI